MGRIEEINMKDIILRSFDFRRIVIPNSEFVTSPIKTYSIESILKIDFESTVDVNLDMKMVVDETRKIVNSFDFIKLKDYTEVLIDSFDDKKCKLKIIFCFDPNFGLSSDNMKSQIQSKLIEIYKKMKIPS